MLQTIFLKIPGQKTTYFYIECKNFTFSMEKVFDKEFKKINIDQRLFEKSKNLIIHNLHFPQDTIHTGEEYDIALGSMIETPEELI